MPSITTLVIATRNEHKLAELRTFLSELPFTIRSLNDFSHVEDIEEDGSTFEENALKKARDVFRLTNLPALADDSGLEVFYLNGRPGVYSARYAGEGATDEANNEKLLQQMMGVAPRRRKSRFTACLALAGPGFQESVTGHCLGHLTESPRGTNGFGYDPLFVPDGFSRTYAELTQDEKNRISHRAMAWRSMKNLLRHYVTGGDV